MNKHVHHHHLLLRHRRRRRQYSYVELHHDECELCRVKNSKLCQLVVLMIVHVDDGDDFDYYYVSEVRDGGGGGGRNNKKMEEEEKRGKRHCQQCRALIKTLTIRCQLNTDDQNLNLYLSFLPDLLPYRPFKRALLAPRKRRWGLLSLVPSPRGSG